MAISHGNFCLLNLRVKNSIILYFFFSVIRFSNLILHFTKLLIQNRLVGEGGETSLLLQMVWETLAYTLHRYL